MRYPAAEKLEIIRLVEQSHLPVRRVLEQIGIPRSTFYRWCDLHQTGGPAALDDCSPRPDRVWNRIPDDVRARIVTRALDEPELSPRELAVRFTDAERYFVSEASVYRLLKAHDLITSPAFIVMKAADEFKDKTTAPDQLWHSELTDDRAGTEHGQNPLVALRRGYDDLEQALLEPIATITGVSCDEQRFAGLTATRRGVAKELRRQGVRQARR